jgi:hypothetical protein
VALPPMGYPAAPGPGPSSYPPDPRYQERGYSSDPRYQSDPRSWPPEAPAPNGYPAQPDGRYPPPPFPAQDPRQYDDRRQFDDRRPPYDDRRQYDERRSYEERRQYEDQRAYDDQRQYGDRRPYPDPYYDGPPPPGRGGGYGADFYRYPSGPYPYGMGPPPPSSSSQQQSAPRQRTSIACRYCRKRKVIPTRIHPWALWPNFQTRANLILVRSAAAVTHTPPTANAPTATSFGSTAFSNPCRRILRPPLFPCRPFREECRREHHFTGRMASRCLQPQRGPRKAARIRIRRLTTPPRCIRRRGHHLRHTTRKMPGAGGRVRQRRSTARDRLRQTILMMTTLAGGLPFRSIATARHPQATTRISKAPMTGNGLPAPGIAALAGPCSHSRRCGTPRPVHRHRCSSPNLHRNKKASSKPLPAGTLTP